MPRSPRPWPVTTDVWLDRARARIHRKTVTDANGCWIWQGALDARGYGKTSVAGRSMPAHRASYFVFRGSFDPVLVIDHLCRVTSCVNPDHLEPVTDKVNVLRGETLPAAQLERTHCPQGHPYTAENLRIRPSGRRACRACQREWSRNLYLKKTRSGPDVCRSGHPLADAALHVIECRSCAAEVRRSRKRAS